MDWKSTQDSEGMLDRQKKKEKEKNFENEVIHEEIGRMEAVDSVQSKITNQRDLLR